jgi:CPA2 family monovalent cation:H+ antiporter-2
MPTTWSARSARRWWSAISAPIASTGAPLASLHLSDLGLAVVGLRRGGHAWSDPRTELPLAAGDELTLRGSPEAFIAAAALFRRAEDAAPAALPPPRAPKYVDTTAPITLTPGARAAQACGHLASTRTVLPQTDGCAECLATGARWVHLRACMTCGHVGCCDSSAGKHATAHFHATGHPIMRSVERGERWGWCFVDKIEL